MRHVGLGLPRCERLLRRADFLALRRDGRRLEGRAFVVYVRARDTQGRRLGIAVARKVGGAVARNRIKRLVREAYRRDREALPGGVDVVVIARGAAVHLDVAAVGRELGALFRRARGRA
jgi:ribonuclease P protein component